MTTHRYFLKLALAAPIAGAIAKLGVFNLEVKAKALALASRVNGFYTGMYVIVTDGTGRGQARQITGYDGTTRTATLSAAWTVTPDSTTTYALVSLNEIQRLIR